MRYIIIDNYSGYIWGDSADFAAGKEQPQSMVDTCKMLDESIGEYERTYEAVSRLSGQNGYVVYRVDVNGGEAVPVVRDGQDRDMIEAVERDCQLLGYVETTRRPD